MVCVGVLSLYIEGSEAVALELRPGRLYGRMDIMVPAGGSRNTYTMKMSNTKVAQSRDIHTMKRSNTKVAQSRNT